MSLHDELYTGQFYAKTRFGALRSARIMVPLIIEMLQPGSVIHLGCGIGTWLAVFREHGIEDVLGVDADLFYRKMLQVPKDKFLGFDLRQPFHLDREFDLALSLEVAEHLPHECAEMFVSSLTRLAPAILFSAAIPYPGGEYSMNEQWPNYWATLFLDRSYVVIDSIRWKVWENEAVDWWYAQNTLLFVKKSYAEDHPSLRSLSQCEPRGLAVIHPKKYTSLISMLDTAFAVNQPRPDLAKIPMWQILSALPPLAMKGLRRRVLKFLLKKEVVW